ncbi:hypothetical protein pb186bvf_019239 [Paramecium bursaria]
MLQVQLLQDLRLKIIILPILDNRSVKLVNPDMSANITTDLKLYLSGVVGYLDVKYQTTNAGTNPIIFIIFLICLSFERDATPKIQGTVVLDFLVRALLHTETNNKSIKDYFQSPRLISPEQDMISYLKKQNENLKLENKRKDNLIGKLLENASYRGSRTKFHPPRTVEPIPQTRLPTIATPLQRFDTLERQNEQNWSFGKDSTKNIRPIKNNLTKPLFKLPQEFHIQAWVKK